MGGILMEDTFWACEKLLINLRLNAFLSNGYQPLTLNIR